VFDDRKHGASGDSENAWNGDSWKRNNEPESAQRTDGDEVGFAFRGNHKFVPHHRITGAGCFSQSAKRAITLRARMKFR
jgi:hypothetical protein